MDTGLFFDYLEVRLNGEKAANTTLTMNFVFPDINKQYVVELNNGSLHHIEGYQSDKANTTITLDRKTLNQIKNETLQQSSDNNKIKIEGNKEALNQLLGLIDSFDFWFNIVTPNQ